MHYQKRQHEHPHTRRHQRTSRRTPITHGQNQGTPHTHKQRQCTPHYTRLYQNSKGNHQHNFHCTRNTKHQNTDSHLTCYAELARLPHHRWRREDVRARYSWQNISAASSLQEVAGQRTSWQQKLSSPSVCILSALLRLCRTQFCLNKLLVKGWGGGGKEK